MIEIIVAMEKERAVLRMPDKLKPCPFCRCNDRRVSVRRQGSKGYRVICGKCGASGPYVAITGNKIAAQSVAIEAWNRRADDER
jgi:Lar family restriction alleviation protein